MQPGVLTRDQCRRVGDDPGSWLDVGGEPAKGGTPRAGERVVSIDVYELDGGMDREGCGHGNESHRDDRFEQGLARGVTEEFRQALGDGVEGGSCEQHEDGQDLYDPTLPVECRRGDGYEEDGREGQEKKLRWTPSPEHHHDAGHAQCDEWPGQ